MPQTHDQQRRSVMKSLVIISALLALTGASTAQAQSVPQRHDIGGPIRQGAYCWVYTNANGAGWWDHCDAQGKAISLHGRENRVDEFSGGGGGAGGGGNR
jgi:hypothetical protein